jgi:hypothetical protein
MTKIMTPSAEEKKMTDKQINKAVSNYRALLEKHSPEFATEPTQTVLGMTELAGEMFDLFRKRVEAISNMIVRQAGVNMSLTPQQVLDATGRRQYTDAKVVATMPRFGLLEDQRVYFFKLGRYVSDAELEKEYELRGLKAAKPDHVAQVNADDPAFADEHPNGTHWQDAEGKWCFAAFDHWLEERRVDVDCDDVGWDDGWWFAGVRK